MDIAMLGATPISEFRVVQAVIEQLRREVGASFLLDSAAQPQQERVTKAQVDRIAGEIDGALGGAYAPIAEGQQGPMIRFALHTLGEKEGTPVHALMHTPTKDKGVTTNLLGDMIPRLNTGISALGREGELNKVFQLISVAAQFGPEVVAANFNIARLIQYAGSMLQVDEIGFIKTPDEIAAEQQAQQQQQIQQEAASQTIESAGNIAEAQAAQLQETAA